MGKKTADEIFEVNVLLILQILRKTMKNRSNLSNSYKTLIIFAVISKICTWLKILLAENHMVTTLKK